MKKLTVDDVRPVSIGRLTIMLNKRKDKIDRLEAIISFMEDRLKNDIEQIKGQATETKGLLQESIDFIESFAKNIHPESEEMIELLSFHDKLRDRLSRMKK